MSLTPVDDALRREIDRWRAAGLGRHLSEPAGIDFCTNDYLGLASDERLVDAAQEALGRYGVGARAARLLAGQGPAHAAAEAAAAAWLGAERTLLFPSGYHANVALLQTLAGRGDAVLSDERNHASIIDGTRLARARTHVFAHNDVHDLERRLRGLTAHRTRYIVVESAYSTDGALAPLAEYDDVAARHDAWLLVDEAHAAGLYGPRGAGRAAGLARVLARTVTGGKALGVAGAFVAGSQALIEALVHRARSFVFTTAPLPALAAALARAIEIVQVDEPRRQAVHATARRLRAALAARGIETCAGSPIVHVPLGTPQAAVDAARALQAAGFDARAVRPPTVPQGASGLRLVCHANHTAQQVLDLADVIADARRAAGGSNPVRAREATPLVVIGTDTDVGKTVVAALLVRGARRHGATVHYWKPLQTGTNDDTARVRALAAPDATPEPAVRLARAASVDQAAAHEGARVTAAQVLAAAQRHLRCSPSARWVFEAAGGLRVPLNPREDQADWLCALGAPVVLVARSGLGTLNHTLLTLEALERRHLALRAVVLVGAPHTANEGTLRAWLPGTPLLCLPRLPSLDAASLDAWIDGQNLEALWR